MGSGAGGREGRPAAAPGSCWGVESKEGSWAARVLLGEGGGARRGVLLEMEGRERSPAGGWGGKREWCPVLGLGSSWGGEAEGGRSD